MIHRVGTVDSTQDIAHTLAAEGAAHGTTVVATEQRSGRGTRGRAWSAGAGGLWMSIVIRPSAPTAVEGLSIRAGLAIAEALDRVIAAGHRIALKWPNDLYADNRKLGGILCEARWAGDRPGWVVVGIGINVANPIPPSLAPFSVRISDLGGPSDPVAIESAVRDAVLTAAPHDGPLSPAELAAFARRDWLAGRRIESPVAGVARGLRPDGRLVVGCDDGTEIAVLGSVTVADLAQARRSH